VAFVAVLDENGTDFRLKLGDPGGIVRPAHARNQGGQEQDPGTWKERPHWNSRTPLVVLSGHPVRGSIDFPGMLTRCLDREFRATGVETTPGRPAPQPHSEKHETDDPRMLVFYPNPLWM
jgi:hypothetical protein